MSHPLKPVEAPWWTDAVIYEVYLRSFADSDGDGVGDLDGVTSGLDYLARLGVDAVWITPFFPSPGHDHGYDVSDFRSIDPLFGDESAFRRLVDRAHDRDLRVLVDVVPNHTSHEHPWFQAARAEGRDGGAYRDYYLWADPGPDGGPPNNWLANFGGPAWTWEPTSGQYYHHSYLPEQPDLNWRHPPVRAEWREILEYWLDLGVDGFRIDVAHNLLKHRDLLDNPVVQHQMQETRLVPVGRARSARTLHRVHDIDQDQTPDLFAAFREGLPRTRRGEEPLLLGETVLEDARRTARYVGPGRLHVAMWFGTDRMHLTAESIAAALQVADLPSPGLFGWFLSNHDRSRPATRLGSADRALATAAMVLTMPGPYLLYQGEELGAIDLPPSVATSRDPIAVRAGEMDMGRDRARSPMPWIDAPGRGFSTAEPWIAHGPLPSAGSAQQQTGAPTSHLERWRALLHAWATIRTRLPRAVAVDQDGDLIVVERGPLRAVLNLAHRPRRLGKIGAGHVLWRSCPDGEAEAAGPEEAVWLMRQQDGEEEVS